ncbi:hypothetical protein B0J11DRAFT_53179 [Dendryphion nanum]|uniref:LCCL domain-containing protein n=1 Tax=Dendryphion nanum TaxID=256645 RepID=A0A9P9DKK3_9PLEO|nr:hypothetical protein B0J11DRAFT_53179 [Dendryphion nanum]
MVSRERSGGRYEHSVHMQQHDDGLGPPRIADDEEAQQLLRTSSHGSPSGSFEFEDAPRKRRNTSASSRSNRPGGSGFWNWIHGPQTPRPQRIQPFFPAYQNAPGRFLARILPKEKTKRGVFVALLCVWGVVFFSILIRAQKPLKIAATGEYVVNLDCVDTLWRPKNECGLDGIDCRPFSNHTFLFRCPAKCAGVQVLNPHPVGPLDVNYRPFVIGDGVYRGDSFVCGSAIHAGIVTDSRGGCGRVEKVGLKEKFGATKKNGIESIGFDSSFPLSFTLSKEPNIVCGEDPRQKLTLVSLMVTSAITVFATTPKFFFPIFVLVFAHVSFASDPPMASFHNVTVLPDHTSMFAKRLLPALFCAVVLYFSVVKRTLSGLQAHVEKWIFWLGGFWFGALSNYTFDWIPLSRLTAHDIEQQPGAKVALAAILVLLVCVIAGQVYFFWLEGRLPRYLGLYGLFLSAIIISILIPGVSLRIHHYVLALLLLPGTTIQTRASLLYQGLLLGLFANGIARWDFDSILQTTDALRGDGTFNSLRPVITSPDIAKVAKGLTATFKWNATPAGIDGISALVNDVERHRSFFADAHERSFVWNREVAGLGPPEYFRFAFVLGGRTLDYTRVFTLFANGTWA